MLDYKLYTFLELCKNMNYRITSEKLNLTQPAVTHHIKQLESEYGCKLFEYRNRVLYKTKQAGILEDYVRCAEYTSQKLMSELVQKGPPRLKIGATKTIGDYIINDKIINLLQTQDVELTYLVDNTDALLQKIRDGQLDFAFLEGFFNKDEFVYHDFYTDKIVGICSEKHPFAGKTVSIEEVFENKLILRENGSGTREAFERILTDNNYTMDNFKTKMQINSLKIIVELVVAGIGISFVYESVANNHDRMATFSISGIEYSHNFSCVHLKNIKPSQYSEFFMN